jgi:acyl-CoA synthetase (AMP-forming)/AMP-acid ligase II
MSQERPPLEYANVGAYLREAVAESKRYAITHLDSVGVIERFTSADVAGAVAHWAQLVREQGLEPGDRVVVLAGPAWEWRCALLGVLYAGGVAVPCPESAPAAALQEIAAHAGATLVVAIPPRPDLADQDGPRAVSAELLETVDPAEALAQPPHRSMPSDAGLILYTRTATGLQGTMHRHASLIAQADAGDHWLGIREGERVWCSAVDGSAASIWLLLAAWRARGNIVTVDLELNPEAKLELLERLRPGALWFSDDDYGELASADAPAWIDLGPIRRALVSDESSAGAVAFADVFGMKAARLFGQTELGVVAGWPAGAEHDAVAEAAMPVPGVQLAVVDEQGSELPADEVGEVVVRGDAQSLFSGYVGAQPPRRDSWLRLGWRGALGADGSLQLASRERVEVSEAEVDMPGPELADEAALAAPDELPDEPESTSRRSKRQAKRVRRREEREAKKLQKAEERRRREEEKARPKQEAKEREEAEAVERAAAEAAEGEERRRAEEAARAEREAAEAEQRRRAEAAALAEREAAERAEREAAEAEERRRAEEAARAEREAAEAEERHRAEEEKRGGRKGRREDKRARRREEKEAKERQKAEAAERAQREAAEAEERRRAEEAARTDERQRAEDEKRRKREQEREEKEARRRAEKQAKEEARAQRKAARTRLRRRSKESEPTRNDAAQSEQEQLSREMVSRIKQYGMTTPPVDPEEPADAEASTESHVAAEPNERRDPE